MQFVAVFLAALVAVATVECQDSPKFGEGSLYDGFQQFVNTLYTNKRYTNLRTETITFAKEKSQLQKDLEEFSKLAMTDEVVAILVDYMTNDKEVLRGLDYMFNKEFHQMVRNVEALKEYQNFVIYLHKAGLNIIEAIQDFHERVGMEEYVPPIVPATTFGKYEAVAYKSKKGGFRGLVDDIKAVLPVKELKALYEKKMSTSAAFREFIKALGSPEFQKIVDAVYSHKIFLEMRKKALEAGLDLEALSELLRMLLGLHFPKP